MTLAVIAGLATGFWLERSRLPVPPLMAAMVVGTCLVNFGAGILLLAAWGLIRLAAVVHLRKTREIRTSAQATLMARLILIAIASGISLRTALDHCVGELSVEGSDELRVLLRRARSIGLAAALESGSGPAGSVLVRLASAQTTGASVAGVLGNYLAEERETRRALAIERARRLPVRMAIPLALMVLPGFVLLAIAPTVLDAVTDLLVPVMP